MASSDTGGFRPMIIIVAWFVGFVSYDMTHNIEPIEKVMVVADVQR